MDLIPKKIYQSWKTLDLPEKMAEIVDRMRNANPEYEYELSDDNNCRQFLLENFGKNYADAFDILTAGAFKCDFWRYAVLYKNGGVYMDIDMSPEIPLDSIIHPEDKLVSVVDRTVEGKIGIYQAFIACAPDHPVLRLALELSFANIVTRRNGESDTLNITGPGVMATAMNLYWGKKNTNAEIHPGAYDRGIRLYKNIGPYTLDLDGRVIFKNKFQGYKGGNYGMLFKYYKDVARPLPRVVRNVLFAIFIILAVIGLGIALFYRKKFKKCEESCSLSSE